jgi:D-sedoheptulose 7-phosphate isomerase
MNAKHDITNTVTTYLDRVRAALDALPLSSLTAVACRLYEAYRGGKKVLIIGNGGSASTASHMACDLSKNIFGQFPTDSRERGRFKVLALTDNVPSITAWANDTNHDRVFLEQVRTFTDPGDVLVAITGSGNSPNVIEAVNIARRLGAETIGLLGFGGGKVKDLVDHAIVVASNEYGPVEDVHLMLNHIFTCCLRQLIAQESSPKDMSRS